MCASFTRSTNIFEQAKQIPETQKSQQKVLKIEKKGLNELLDEVDQFLTEIVN